MQKNVVLYVLFHNPFRCRRQPFHLLKIRRFFFDRGDFFKQRDRKRFGHSFAFRKRERRYFVECVKGFFKVFFRHVPVRKRDARACKNQRAGLSVMRKTWKIEVVFHKSFDKNRVVFVKPFFKGIKFPFSPDLFGNDFVAFFDLRFHGRDVKAFPCGFGRRKHFCKFPDLPFKVGTSFVQRDVFVIFFP